MANIFGNSKLCGTEATIFSNTIQPVQKDVVESAIVDQILTIRSTDQFDPGSKTPDNQLAELNCPQILASKTAGFLNPHGATLTSGQKTMSPDLGSWQNDTELVVRLSLGLQIFR